MTENKLKALLSEKILTSAEPTAVNIQCINCGKTDIGTFILDKFKVTNYEEIMFPYVCSDCEKIAQEQGVKPEDIKSRLIDMTTARVLKSMDRLN